MPVLLKNNEINKAVNLLKNNSIIILPTDTIYGISSLVNDDNKIRINKIKNSNLKKQLIILVANLKQASIFVDVDKRFKKIIKQKNTTVIYKKKLNKEKFALRLIRKKDLQKIIKKTGPIFSTSVNASGKNFLNTEYELRNFSNEIKEVFFVGELHGSPSRIIDIVEDVKKR